MWGAYLDAWQSQTTSKVFCVRQTNQLMHMGHGLWLDLGLLLIKYKQQDEHCVNHVSGPSYTMV